MMTPELGQVIKEAIEAQLLTVNTAMPAQVVRVDVSKGLVDVQPVLQRKYNDGTVAKLPVITNVPIAHYRAGEAFISLPVKVGHYVQLQFSQRSLDKWLEQGGVIDPADPRHHSLNDAVAYPGIYPFNDPPTGADADDIVVKNAKGVLRVKPAGKFQLTNGTNELVDLVKQLGQKLIVALATLNTDTTNTMLGPMKLNSFADYGTLKGQVEEIVGKVDSLKG